MHHKGVGRVYMYLVVIPAVYRVLQVGCQLQNAKLSGQLYRVLQVGCLLQTANVKL